MNPVETIKRHPTAYPILIILLVSALFILPSAYQQLFLDQLPITGDLIHRRVVYMLTNFPNFVDAPSQLLSHSLLYHHLIAAFNIVTGLTNGRAYDGMTLVGYVMLFLSGLSIYVLTYRLSPRWAIFSPLLAFSNPNLVLPFLGHANQHLIYVFLTLFLFVLLFFPSTIGTKIAALLLLGVTLNSSLAITLPLILIVLLLERFKKESKPLLLLALAFLLYLPYLTIPVRYLVLNDVTGSINDIGPLLLLGLGGVGAILILDAITRSRARLHRIIVTAGMILAIAFFVIPRGEGAFAINSTAQEISAGQNAFRSVNIVHYLFAINPQKGFPGFDLYLPVTLLLFFLGVITFFEYRKKLLPSFRLLLLILLVPVFLSLLRLFLFAISYEVFSRTPLTYLIPGRSMVITLFLLPVFFILPISKLKNHLTKIVMIGVMITLTINIVFISSFASRRVFENWSQTQSQALILESLKKGYGQNLTPIEGIYACKYFGQCNLPGYSGGGL